MRNSMLLALTVSIFLLASCGVSETRVDEEEKVVSDSKPLEIEIPQKDSELIYVNQEGEQVSVPATIQKDVTDFVKEIKVPDGFDVVKDVESDQLIVAQGGAKFTYILRDFSGSSSEILIQSFKRMEELSEKGRLVPVIELDVTNYPVIFHLYDSMHLADGTNAKKIYLVKDFVDKEGDRKIREALIIFESKTLNENQLNKFLAVVASIK